MKHTQIPADLRATPQWVGWRTEPRSGDPTKVPLNPATGGYADVTTPATWSTFATAYRYYRDSTDVDGIGFVFTATDRYAGVDLDACRDPETGVIDDWALDIIEQLDSYTEYSPSGTGLHVIVTGTVPAGGNRTEHIEFYDRNRYFTVTGDRLPGTPATIEDRADELTTLHQEVIGEPDHKPVTVPPADRPDVAISDEDLIAKAMNAANGAKFRALWVGDTSDYPSHSEADQALCNLLAFWTGGDPQRMEALFSQSGLARTKWRNRPDYRERTIQKAIRDCSSFYGHN